MVPIRTKIGSFGHAAKRTDGMVPIGTETCRNSRTSWVVRDFEPVGWFGILNQLGGSGFWHPFAVKRTDGVVRGFRNQFRFETFGTTKLVRIAGTTW